MGNDKRIEDKIDEMLASKNLLTSNELYWVQAIDKTVGKGQGGKLSKRQYAVLCDIYRRFKEK
jgi:hypothetical protein